MSSPIMTMLQKQLEFADDKVERYREAYQEAIWALEKNLEQDKKMHKISNGMGASTSNILRAMGSIECCKEILK